MVINFSARTARYMLTIKAAREIKKEIAAAGLDNLKALLERNVSIVGTYLQGCSPQKQKEYRQNFTRLISLGVTPEMVLDEVALQMPEIGSIMRGKGAYRQAELNKIKQFLKGA